MTQSLLSYAIQNVSKLDNSLFMTIFSSLPSSLTSAKKTSYLLLSRPKSSRSSQAWGLNLLDLSLKLNAREHMKHLDFRLILPILDFKPHFKYTIVQHKLIEHQFNAL